jgi:hypothetical protein
VCAHTPSSDDLWSTLSTGRRLMRLMPALGSLGPRTLERSFMSVTYANPFTPHFSVGLDMFCNHRWGFEVTAAPPRYSIPYVQIKRVRAQLRLLAWWCHTWKVLACRNGSLSAYCAPTCETHNLRVLTRHAISFVSPSILDRFDAIVTMGKKNSGLTDTGYTCARTYSRVTVYR